MKTCSVSLLLVLACGLTGCVSVVRTGGSAAPAAPTSFAGSASWLRTELYFGLAVEGGEGGITEEQWRAFLDAEVTPRFPDGFSVVDAYGQWRDDAGSPVERLRSKVILLLHPRGAAAEESIEAIRRAFTTRFEQISVLRSTQPAEVGF